MSEVSELVGKTLTSVSQTARDEIVFAFDGGEYKMYHYQDCCEDVVIEDIVGDLTDLVGSPILMAEEATSDENPKPESDYSFTWTFYKFATAKGHVTIRWYGTSNGYYSESVSFEESK